MNRTEAKAYALDVLGLDRDDVRSFGNLSRTQTWLDAIAAFEAAAEPTETADVNLDSFEDAPATEALCEAIVIPEDSFITFWEAESEPVVPQPLECLPELDEVWDEPEPVIPVPAVYPVVILLMMLWAVVQVLLLGGKVLCWVLIGVGQWLDGMAQARFEDRREIVEQLTSGVFTLAVP